MHLLDANWDQRRGLRVFHTALCQREFSYSDQALTKECFPCYLKASVVVDLSDFPMVFILSPDHFFNLSSIL